MTFLAPGFLIAAAIAACGMIALHFIVTRRPRSVSFPTTRFVPDVPLAARARSFRFSDLLLLVVRVLTILLAGAALAMPVFTPSREKIVRVLAADVSGSVASVAEVRDSVRALLRPGDAMIAFDTAAWPVASADSIVNRAGVALPGSLSAGLVAALRAGSRVRDGADSVQLLIISPIVSEERDRATSVIRSRWPGRARVVRVSPAKDSAPLQLERPAFLGDARPAFAIPRRRIDTVGAVVAGGNVVIGRFERRWRFVSDSLKGSRVIARWIDGDPAAIERISGHSCRKSVLVAPDSTGDMMLRPDWTEFRESLSAPCGRAGSTPDIGLAQMLAGGTGRLASAAEFPAAMDVDSPLARWLIALALILAILEIAMRSAERRVKRDAEDER